MGRVITYDNATFLAHFLPLSCQLIVNIS